MVRCVLSFAILASCCAGTFIADALGQSSSSSQPSNAPTRPSAQQDSSGNSAPAKSEKTKKVWTENDLNSLKSRVSVVGDPSKTQKSSQKPPQDRQVGASLPPEKDPAWYRRQLAPLRAQIEQIDVEVHKMKGVQDGKETSDPGRRYNGFDRPMNSQDRIEYLGKKKAELQAKIDLLEDQARHNGLNPGDLR